MSLPVELRRALGRHGQRLQHWRRTQPPLCDGDAALREALATVGEPQALYEAAFDYLVRAQQHYRTRGGTLADYPGWPSIYGATSDAIEGVTRLLPLWAVEAVHGDGYRRRAALDLLLESLGHGTDPAHPGYWGPVTDRSTLICEAGDIALAAWLAREPLQAAMDPPAWRRLMDWLRQVPGRTTADNNWHLFVVLVDAVLAALDPAHRFLSQDRLDRVRDFARADGCFVDGPRGFVDFYNAWGFHYPLFWLVEMGALRADDPLAQALADFCHWYQWLFTPRGLPLFGRSLCYRFAAATPLLAGALHHPDAVAPATAIAAQMAVWRFFAAEGGIAAGRPTQGVFGDDARWLDPYSGPASSLWGTRSLVVQRHVGARWGAWPLPAPLPAQCSNIEIAVGGMGAVVRSTAVPCTSSVEFVGALVAPAVSSRTSGAAAWRRRLRAGLLGVTDRTGCNLLAQGVKQFTSTLDAYR